MRIDFGLIIIGGKKGLNMQTASKVTSIIGITISLLGFFGLISEPSTPDIGAGLFVCIVWGIQSVITLIYSNK